jgi:hypothetical protein
MYLIQVVSKQLVKPIATILFQVSFALYDINIASEGQLHLYLSYCVHHVCQTVCLNEM